MKIITNKLKLSPVEAYLAARALIDPIRDFYKIPKHEAEFQEWLNVRKGEKRNGEIKSDY